MKNKWEIIERAGGLLVSRGEITASAVVKWKSMAYIPPVKHAAVVNAASDLGFELSYQDLREINAS